MLMLYKKLLPIRIKQVYEVFLYIFKALTNGLENERTSKWLQLDLVSCWVM